MNPINLEDYVDVAERIRLFTEKHPEGTLQGSGEFVYGIQNEIIGFIYTARAYRTAEDLRPGVGTAFEAIPGTTPYTRGSEVQNAETSAWGRAIVAVGIPSKRIASANEVAARQVEPAAGPGPDDVKSVTKAQHGKIGVLVKELMDISEKDPDSQADWVQASREFCLTRFGKHSRAELTSAEAGQLIDWLEEQVVIAGVPFG